MKMNWLGLLIALFIVGCSKKETTLNLGTIELVPNTPKHVNVNGHDWIFTETVTAAGKPSITAKQVEWKVTPQDIARGIAPPGAPVGATVSASIDLTGLSPGVESFGYLGQTLTRYTLKYDAK